MSLTNSQYESIINRYEQNRLTAHKILEDRKKEVFVKIPEYKAVCDEIVSVSIQKAREAVSGNDASVEELAEIIDSLVTKKKLLLTKHGYRVDYLDSFYFCPDCKDTGFINGEKCSCFKQAELDLLYDQLNLQDSIRKDTFDSISYDFCSGEDLTRLTNTVNVCKDLVDTFEKKHKSILFFGTVGTGKTFLSNCIVNALIGQGYSCIYFTSTNLFERLSEYKFQKNDKDYLPNPMDDICGCDLLIIDDLGTELTNSFVQSELFCVLESRLSNHKSTIISTNFDLKDIKERYDDRIFSRIYSNFEMCRLSGEDIRIINKQMSLRK